MPCIALEVHLICASMPYVHSLWVILLDFCFYDTARGDHKSKIPGFFLDLRHNRTLLRHKNPVIVRCFRVHVVLVTRT